MTDTRDYSATLCLPQTAFPMRAGLPHKEPELLERWRRLDMYQRLRRAAAGTSGARRADAGGAERHRSRNSDRRRAENAWRAVSR